MPNKELIAEYDGSIASIEQGMNQLAAPLQDAVVSGDTERAEKLKATMLELDQKRSNLYVEREGVVRFARSAAAKSLQTAGYQVLDDAPPTMSGVIGGAPITQPRGVDTQRTQANLQRDIAEYAGLDKSQIDFGDTLPATEIGAMKSLPTMESKMQYLANQYGAENVMPVNIAGADEAIVKLPDGRVVTTKTGKGFAADLAGKAGATIAEVPAAIGSAAASIGTLVGTKSPTLAAGAGGIAHTAIAAPQDMLTRFALGVDMRPGEAFARRGFEGLAGAGLDLATAGASSVFTKRIGVPIENQFAKRLTDSAERLSAVTGKDITVPAGAQFGPQVLAEQQILFGKYKGGITSMLSGKGTKQALRTRENLVDLAQIMTARSSDDVGREGAYAATAKKVAGDFDALKRSTQRLGPKVNKMLTDKLDREAAQFQVRKENREQLVEFMREQLSSAERAAKDARRVAYEERDSIADDVGFSVEPDELLYVLRRSERTHKPDVKSRAAAALRAKLERRKANTKAINEIERAMSAGGANVDPSLYQRILDLRADSGPLDAATLDSYIKDVTEALPGGQLVAKQQQNKASLIFGDLEQFRDKKMSQFPELANAQREAVARHHAYKDYASQNIGTILKNDGFGRFANDPEAALKAAMQEPSAVRRVLTSIGKADPAAADMMRDKLQREYLHQIGAASENIGTQTGIQFDREMVESLWGGAPGTAEAMRGRRMVDSLGKLNKALKDSKLDAKGLNPEDIYRLAKVQDDQSRRKIIKEIAKNQQANKDLARFEAQHIVKLAQEGDWGSIPTSKLLDTYFSGDVGDKSARAILNSMTPADRAIFKGDVYRRLFDDMAGAADSQTAHHMALWDDTKMIRALENTDGKPTALRKKLDQVLDRDEVQTILDLSRVRDANKASVAPTPEQVRMTGGSAGVSVYLASGVTGSLRNRMIATALGSGLMTKKELAKYVVKDVGQRARDEAMQRVMRRLFVTRRGVTALAEAGRDDPEFNAQLENMVAAFRDRQQQIQRGQYE